ncbi:MAG TPA: D-sedoheptulose 7-phosphate isomerase [Bacteroidales bacterium]
MQQKIINAIKESAGVKNAILENPQIIDALQNIVEKIVLCYQNGGKVLFCGNGGSAADAQHLAAELSGRFYYDRAPLYAEALHVNTSYLTAVANDYSYDEVYARLVKAMGRKGDILIGLSTSGNSGNILRALIQAKQLEMLTFGLTGESGGKMKELCDLTICIPSAVTPRIQESHILIGHIICEMVESTLFPKP